MKTVLSPWWETLFLCVLSKTSSPELCTSPSLKDVAIYTNALSDIYASPSSSVSVCRIWMSSCCRPPYTAWLISRGNTNELCLSPKTSWNTRWDHFCIDDISDIVFLFFPLDGLERLPVFFFFFNQVVLCFVCFLFSFWSFSRNIYLNVHFYAFAIHNLHHQSIFVNVVQGHAIFANKKKKKKDYNLKNQCAKSNNAV